MKIKEKKDRVRAARELFSGLDKKLFLSGLAGISPIPVVGEIGMYIFIDKLLDYSLFSGFAKKTIAGSMALLTRVCGIYPLYYGLYKYISNFAD